MKIDHFDIGRNIIFLKVNATSSHDATEVECSIKERLLTIFYADDINMLRVYEIGPSMIA